MRPFRSFLILLILLACLIGLGYLAPGNLKLPLINEFIPWNLKVEDKAGDSVVADEPQIPVADTLFRPVDGLPVPGIIVTDTVSGEIAGPLRHFFDLMEEPGEQIRIMYYGDSQIEGDRVTSSLRHMLREDHGGTGPGLFLPLMPVMYTKSVSLRASSNWKRYNYLSYREGEITHRDLGPFMTVCRYLPEGVRSASPVKASVRIVPSAFAGRTDSIFENLRIFYGNSSGNVRILVRANNYLLYTDTLKNGPGIHEAGCFLYNAHNIYIEFEGRTSPDIYGISIESSEGLIIDNIPQRGSAGLEFTMVGSDHLKEFYRILSPDLFVLHYGLNIVKNVREEYSYYERGLLRQLALLRDMSPETPVIVVGLTDMAYREGDRIISYPNIPAIIEAQRNAAAEAGALFWNTWQEMGGESSIVRWAERIPPLAQKDFIHFTNPGADTLGKMLFTEFFAGRSRDTLTEPGRPEGSYADLRKPVPAVSAGRTGDAEEEVVASVISGIFRYNPTKPFIFSAPAFWIFFLLVLAGYSLIYKKLSGRNLYLFVVSLFFYYKTGGLFLLLLIIVTFIDFFCGLLIHRSESVRSRRLFLVLSILSNIGILAYFKYTGFFVDTLNNLLGTSIEVYDYLAAFSNTHLGTSFNVSNIILPVGISFFTFQSLSYTMDVYLRKLEPVRNMVDFGFYVSFFPQLVAGPIVRASEFIPQLYAEFHLARREFSHALFLISKGLIKKIIISDFIAVNFVDRVFELPAVYSGFENLMAVYGYGLQIYCDFSGYTDIAIGLGLILGFRIPVNFNSPYKAVGISDFWKRWHISLSRWLRDYLYIPLGGNRKGKVRTGFNLMITMLLGGLWHGAALRFIIWGGLHGVGLVISKLWEFLFGSHIVRNRMTRALMVFLTFQFVSFCWIFFRAPDMEHAFIMLNQIAANFSPGSYLAVLPMYSTVFSLIIAGYLIHFLPEKVKESYRGLFIRIPLAVQLVAVLLMAVVIYQIRTADIMPFIYFRF